MGKRLLAVTVVLFLFSGLNLQAQHANAKKHTGKPDRSQIKKLETIELSYKITEQGLQLKWHPANKPPSGGIKITASADNPQPLYPYDGYIKWLPGTGKSSCLISPHKATSRRYRYWRICSVHRKNHRRYVALSNVVQVPIDSWSDRKKSHSPRKAENKRKPSDSAEKHRASKKKADVEDSASALPPAQAIKHSGRAVIIGHNNTDIDQIPAIFLTKAKRNFRVWYGHTSHGSQITSGMRAMNHPPFQFNRTGRNG